MKKSTFLLLLLTLFSFSSFAQFSTVNVSGFVTDINTGEPAAGHGVFIVTDSLNGVGYINLVFTNEEGLYNDSFDVPEQSEGMVTVFTFDCNEESYFEELFYGPDNYDLTADFEFCTQLNPEDCYADFWYYQMDSLSVEFMDYSWPEPSTWAWDFGDGTTSEEQNPVYQYAEPGIYPVMLTITVEETGCTSTTMYDVWVDDLNYDCYAWYFWYPSGEEPLGIQFEDYSFFQGGSYFWEFGDGNTSGEQNPMHVFAEEGEYEVSLTITSADSSCIDTYTEIIYIEDFNFDCQAEFWYYQIDESTLQFEDYSFPDPDTWAWDFGDGNSSTEQSPVHTYEMPGLYNVCLSISNIEAGCEDTRCYEVFVDTMNYIDCYADFWYYQMDSLSVEFMDYSFPNPSSWAWDFGDGTTSEEQNPVHQYAEPGIYPVMLTITVEETGCTSTTMYDVWVDDFNYDCFASYSWNPSYEEPLAIDFTDFSFFEPGSWFWEFGDGNTSTEQNPMHLYAEEGEYEVTLNIMSEDSSCMDSYAEIVYASSTVPVLVTVSGIVTDIDTGDPVANQFVFISVDSVNSFGLLTNEDGEYLHSFDIDPAQPEGMVTVFTFDCNDEIVSQELMYGPGNYALTADFVICPQFQLEDCYADFWYYQMEDLNVEFMDYSWPNPSSWAWDFGDGTTSEEQNPVHQYAEAGIYPVMLTITVDETGCTSTTIFDVWVYDYNYYCQALYYWFPEGGDPLSINFFDLSFFQGDVQYLWEFGDGGTSNEQNPVHTFSEEGEYDVCLTISRPDSSCYSTFCEVVFVGNQFPSECESTFEIIPIQDLSYQFEGFMVNGTMGGDYYWDFGDGNTGFGQSTEHTYDQAGEYVVCLSTLSSNNPADSCFWISCQMLLVGSGNAPMQASFSMMQDSLNPMMMHFYDVSSGNPQGWLWEFGDGTTSDLQHPVHEFSQTANYDVCLTIFGQGMTDMQCHQVDMTNATVSVADNDSPIEKVYPNPNNGNFFIDISSAIEGPVQVQLINFVGQTVYSADDMIYSGGKKIEVIAPDLPGGVYSLIVKSGSSQITRKIVIE